MPGNLEFNAKPSDWIIVGIGVLGGLTSAGLGIAKNHVKAKENSKIVNSVSHPESAVAQKTKEHLAVNLPRISLLIRGNLQELFLLQQ